MGVGVDRQDRVKDRVMRYLEGRPHRCQLWQRALLEEAGMLGARPVALALTTSPTQHWLLSRSHSEAGRQALCDAQSPPAPRPVPPTCSSCSTMLSLSIASCAIFCATAVAARAALCGRGVGGTKGARER
jgi:hypothetical protein